MIPNKQRGWKTALEKVQQTKEPSKLSSKFCTKPLPADKVCRKLAEQILANLLLPFSRKEKKDQRQPVKKLF